MKRTALFIPMVITLLIVSIAIAQSGSGYDVSWNTVDGGGGLSAGGYTLDHTIGQFDAGEQSGGGYVLQGGFWAGINTSAAPAPNYWLYLPALRR